MVLYCDADFAGDLKDSKSTSGSVVALVGQNTYVPVSAWCKKQPVIAHSSTEAEVVSLDMALHQEGLPVLTFWEEVVKLFGSKRPETRDPSKPLVPFVIAEDNESAIKICRNGRAPTMRHLHRTQRVNMDRLHETCTSEKVELRYINTHSQVADILTKHFTKVDAWNNLCRLLNIRPPPLTKRSCSVLFLSSLNARTSKCAGREPRRRRSHIACQA